MTNLLQKLSLVAFATLSLETAFLFLPSTVKAYPPEPDAQCPNGYDMRTQPPTCILDPYDGGGGGGGNLDAACQATAEFKYCQGAVYVGCQSGSEMGCRLLELSNLDPNTFQQIMSASRACNLDGNQQACNYIMQFKGYYF
jgi:hypothetical protein